MQVEANIAEDAVFMGEESDLVELCGVLLDNAFKYGRSNIGIEVTLMDNILALVFDDDGPGIAEQDRHWVLQRGARADTVNVRNPTAAGPSATGSTVSLPLRTHTSGTSRVSWPSNRTRAV